MRKLAWLLVVLLFLLSAMFFVRYADLTAMAARPEAKMLLELGQVLLRFSAVRQAADAVRQAADAIGNLRGVKESADFALYVSIGFAWLGILSIVLLAATRKKRGRQYDDDLDEPHGRPNVCPECGERFRGFEITCRACGASLVAQARRGRR